LAIFYSVSVWYLHKSSKNGVSFFKIAVLRPPSLQARQIELESTLSELKTTSYQRRAPFEDAPSKTDCLTSIHYIFHKVFNRSLPLDLVGDMPRLLSQSGWSLKIVNSNELCIGDLVFLKRKSETKLVAHAALVIGPNRIFHCKRDAGAVIESIEKVWGVFEQALKKDLLKYIDPRNTALRKKCGIFLKEEKTHQMKTIPQNVVNLCE
jgi:cell wall-associated NlpC family hydrolase